MLFLKKQLWNFCKCRISDENCYSDDDNSVSESLDSDIVNLFNSDSQCSNFDGFISS